MPGAEVPSVCISIHDVAPATWPACERLLAMTDDFGHVPVTLLVVPDYHRQGPADRHRTFVRAVEKRLAKGDEVALHGYYHLDEGMPPRTPAEWFRRRILTRAEGEFSQISFAVAEQRIARGLVMMRTLGWPVTGFIAPAWLLGTEARRALGQFPFAYTTTRMGFFRLPGWQWTLSPSLVYSPGASWRHAMSVVLNDLTLLAMQPRDVLRVSLHPAEAGSPRAIRHWLMVLRRVLRTHRAVTKREWVQMAALRESVRRDPDPCAGHARVGSPCRQTRSTTSPPG